MNSNGFREKEINGKPFFIYTLFSQKGNPSSSGEASIDSGGDINFPLQTLFYRPTLRRKVEKATRRKNDYHSEDGSLPFHIPPDFHKLRNTANKEFCKLPVAPLFWCNNKEPDYEQFDCGACKMPDLGTSYYLRVTCLKMFHKECVQSPLEIKEHPSNPFLSLQLYTPPRSNKTYWICISCEIPMIKMAYHCPTYKLSMHLVCALKPIPIVIEHLKRHPHPLTFFPKQAFLPCNICGVVKEFIPTYVCLRCVFVVHQDCIHFPNVIRISLHQHRISFTSSLPYGNWSCGVCRKKVGNDCGAFFCNKCDEYFVYTRCALRKDVWDGKDLEGVPEEPEIDVEPFERIADGIILHFSHNHHLKLKMRKVYDENKFCQACVLPVYEGRSYTCMEGCDFTLHEACADAPRKKYHGLHAHLLTLKVVNSEYNDYEGYFRCEACWRESCGFVYERSMEADYVFRLDLKCASVSELFEYQG